MQGPRGLSPLTVDRLLRYAAAAHGQVEVVTAAAEGAPRRLGYGRLEARVRRLAGALVESGVRPGDVVAVIGCAGARQLEAWFAIMMAGAACHPIDPSLPAEQAASLLRAQGDKAVMVDPQLLAALEPSLLKLPRLERVIAMGEAGQDLDTRMNAVVSQDALMEGAGQPLAASLAEEDHAALLMHSALAGGPTPWSQRLCVLQALAARGADGLRLGPDEALLVLTPPWRSAGAAAVLAAVGAGCKLVLPAGRTEIPQLRILADRESATIALGSPAQLQALHDQFRAEGRKPLSLKRVIATGAPCAQALVRAWRESFGIELASAWGAAEVAGLAAVGQPPAGLLPLFGVELELLDADGRPRPHDGVAIGRLAARGPLVAAADAAALLDTGDLATIDAQGRIALLGRADEQVIAAGGQIPAWPLEAAALEHPATALAAAIDPPRGLECDGPVLVVERKPGALAGKPDYLRFLGDRLGGLKLGELLFVNGFPMDAAGRIDKTGLRQRLEQLIAPQAPAQAPAEPAPEAPEPSLEPAAAEPPVAEPPATDPAVSEPVPEAPPEPAAPAAALALAAAAAPVLFQDEPAAPEAETPPPDAPEAPPEAEVRSLPPAPTPETEVDASSSSEAVPTASEPAEGELAEALPDGEAPGEEPSQAQTELPETAPAEAEAVEADPTEVEPAEAAAPETEAPEASAVEPLSLGPSPEPEAAPEAEDERPMVLRLDTRPHRARRNALGRLGRAELFLNLAGLLALAPVLMILVGALGVRFGLLDWRVGVGELILDWPSKLALIAVLAGIFAIFAAVTAGFRKYGLRAAFSLALPLVTLAALVWLKSVGEAYPPVHDVATDWTRPIAFSPALLRERGADAFPVDADPFVPASAGAYMNRRVAEVNAETCPGAKPALLSLPPAEAYARAKAAMQAQGLALFGDSPAQGRLEATATNLWLGLKDDVAVRVTPAPNGARVDVRSISRGGPADYGANCRRVTGLVRRIAEAQPGSR